VSLYEKRLSQDLAAIAEKVTALGDAIDVAIADALTSLLTRDRRLAYQTVINDLPINRATREIDDACHALIVQHYPAARHLRYVSSVLRLTVAMERIGDYAVTIAREGVQLSIPIPPTFAGHVELIGEQSKRMLRKALAAFREQDAEAARSVMGMADQVEVTYDRIFSDLISERGDAGDRDVFSLLGAFNQIERVSDQAKNICEETVFVVTGQTKAPKVYRILFVDEANSCHSVLAEFIAVRAFPKSGRYDSAGWSPTSEFVPEVIQFCEGKGMRATKASPTALSDRRLDEYHAVVCLRGDLLQHVERLPFHTSLLEWEIPELSNGVSLEDVHQQISAEVAQLMTTMRGDGAN